MTPPRSALEIRGELQGDAVLGVARQDEHVPVDVGEQCDDGLQRAGIHGVEGGLHVGQLGGAMAGDRPVTAQLADALGRRSQLV